MNHYDNPYFFRNPEMPVLPDMQPIGGCMKLWELEEDDAYLKYLYPLITRRICEFVEDICDQMEFEGSLMFDACPDKTALQITASGIARDFEKKYPDEMPEDKKLFRDLIEVVLYHEILYRRSRYRNHKRLYL